jgi:hypothetical protein
MRRHQDIALTVGITEVVLIATWWVFNAVIRVTTLD